MGKAKRTDLPAKDNAGHESAVLSAEQFVRENHPKLQAMRVELKGGHAADAKQRAKAKAARKARRKCRK